MVAGPAGRSAFVTGLASALPPAVDQSELLEGFFAGRFASERLTRAAFAAAGVRRRHAALDPRVEDCSSWSTARRMDRYVSEALPLASAAVAGALGAAGLDPAEVGLFAVVSCTGYATPGLDVLVSRELGLSGEARRLSIAPLGCHAALPGLATAADFVACWGRPAVLCCVELPSLHLQPAGDDPGQALVHALFGDAAGAVVLEPAAPGTAGARPLEVVATATSSELESADALTWTVTDRGFRMRLSRRVPAAVAAAVGPLVDRLLRPRRLGVGDVDAWVVHPGGPRVLEVVGDALGLPACALAGSRRLLAERGNCSSATVLLGLEALRAEQALEQGGRVGLLAFGPGLSSWGALLEAR